VTTTGGALHLAYVVQEWLPAQLNGIARLTHSRAVGLAARGHTVRVITRSGGPRSVELESGVWVHRVPTTAHPRPSDETVPQALWDRSASALDELRRIEAGQPLDAVDVPNWDVEGLAAIRSREFVTILGLYTSLMSYVLVDGRFDANDPEVRAVLDAERRCYLGADGFLAASSAIVEEIEREFKVTLPRDRLGMVPHGLPRPDPPAEPARVVRSSDQRPLEVLYVGRLEARKGIATVLAAIPRIVGEFRRVRFTIAGDDTISSPTGRTFRDEFAASWAGRQFGHLVTFTGVVSGDELDQLYRRCDVFVAPSLFESFGLVLLEAMRLGKPVVASDTSGMREVVGDDHAGVLVPPDNPQILADAVVALLRDPGYRATVGLAGRQRFERRFTQDRMVEAVEAFIRSLVATVRSAR
jgi:glycosyltransferase involved in cell wall biosynthesis